MNFRLGSWAAIAAILWPVVGGACVQRPLDAQPLRPDPLIVLPGAIDVRDTEENEATVAYELDAAYPADWVIHEIGRRLEGAGWRPLREDFMNPGGQSSHVRGWVNFEDRTKARPTDVHQWAAQWEDNSKRIVWYVLRYETPMSGADSRIPPKGRLRVSATLLSADTAEALRDAAKKAGIPRSVHAIRHDGSAYVHAKEIWWTDASSTRCVGSSDKVVSMTLQR